MCRDIPTCGDQPLRVPREIWISTTRLTTEIQFTVGLSIAERHNLTPAFGAKGRRARARVCLRHVQSNQHIASERIRHKGMAIFRILPRNNFNNKNCSFTLIYFYVIKILVLPWKCVTYVDVILQACRGRNKRLRIAGLKHCRYYSPRKNNLSHCISVLTVAVLILINRLCPNPNSRCLKYRTT